MLFAVGAHDGTLLIYDLRQNRATPTLRLEAGSKKEPVFSVEFSQAQCVIFLNICVLGRIQSSSVRDLFKSYNLCRQFSRHYLQITFCNICKMNNILLWSFPYFGMAQLDGLNFFTLLLCLSTPVLCMSPPRFCSSYLSVSTHLHILIITSRSVFVSNHFHFRVF